MDRAFTLLVLTGAVGLLVIALLLQLRRADQRRRDTSRDVFLVAFPRTVTAEQVTNFLATLIGLATPRIGFVGRDAAVIEIVATRAGITYRLRLAPNAASYFVAQLRAAVPGIRVSKLSDKDAILPPVSIGRELRLSDPTRPLSDLDPEAVARAVLAAATGLRGADVVVWQVVAAGGTYSMPNSMLSMRNLMHAVFYGTQNDDKTKKNVIDNVATVLRVGASARSAGRRAELVARLLRAAASVSAPGVRLVPRLLPSRLVCARLDRGATPLVESPVFLPREKLVGLLGWPLGAPLIPGLVLGGSPQLLVSPLVPTKGRVLGLATVGGERRIAQGVKAAREHSLYLGPTGSGKTWLAAQVALSDIAAGRGVLVVDPKGGLIDAILDRLLESAIDRTVLVDPLDETRPVPLPLLSAEKGGLPELAADTLVSLLRHRYRDLGPRSSDILSSSLYALAKLPDATLFDLLPLWTNAPFRARVAGLAAGDPALSSFFAWFEALTPAERNFVLAAPMNKIRPLLQRPLVRNVLAGPHATFSLSQALAKRLIVLVKLPEGVIGSDATGLLGQVVIARLWAAVQGRARLAPAARKSYFVTIDEAPRFLDTGVDLGDVLARSREYGVGVSLLVQSITQLPTGLREITLNSARTKVAFQTSATDARRLAAEFGPTVTPDMLSGLSAFEAIGAVSLGGAVSDPFTMKTTPLGEVVPGRAKAVRAASRERYGVPRADIEQSFARHQPPPDATGPIGRRAQR